MLYTSQAPVLYLTGEHIKTTEDIEAAFHAFHLCPQEEQKSDGRKEKKNQQIKVSLLQIAILLMILKSTLHLKLQ